MNKAPLDIAFERFLMDVCESSLADTDSFGAALLAGVSYAFDARRGGLPEQVILDALMDVIDHS